MAFHSRRCAVAACHALAHQVALVLASLLVAGMAADTGEQARVGPCHAGRWQLRPARRRAVTARASWPPQIGAPASRTSTQRARCCRAAPDRQHPHLLLLCLPDARAGRSLQQTITYDCAGAKRISTVKNACSLLCSCAGSLNKAYNTPAMLKFCNDSCAKCSAAAATCKNNQLPKECAMGRGIKEVNTCITTFLKAQG